MDLDTEVRPQGNLECFSGNRVLPPSSDSLPLRHSDHSTKGASGAEFPRMIVARTPLVIKTAKQRTT